jgi:aspartate/methionine/tyrosine aminotransferase
MGTVFSEQHMKDVLAFADQNQLPIVADEVYLRQTFPNYEHKSYGEITVDVPVIVLCG